MSDFLLEREVVAQIPGGEDAFWSRPDRLAGLETPCFVFDPARILAAYQRLKTALGTPLIVSIKANPNPDVLARCVHEVADGVEVASIGELNVVIGRAPGPKFVASPALDEALVLAAASCRAHIVVDSRAQADLLIELRPRLRTPPALLIRVNAGALLAGQTSGLKADHFGVEPTEAVALAQALQAADFKVSGLNVFAGSGAFARTAPFIAQAMQALAERVSEALGQPLSILNLGGGFDTSWEDDPTLMAAYCGSLAPLRRHFTVVHESGRAVFEPGGTFVTRVVSTKALGGRWIAVCDGGMAQAFRLAQTETFIKNRRAPIVVPAGPSAPPSDRPVSFVGNSCNPADIIGAAEGMPPPRAGDVVLFDRLGAYHTYTPTAFLNLRNAKKYLVS
jgi:diaminopimelate decarboxylase